MAILAVAFVLSFGHRGQDQTGLRARREHPDPQEDDDEDFPVTSPGQAA